MSEFAWFKLLIRALGVLFLGIAVPQLLRLLSAVFMMELRSTPGIQSGPWDALLANLPSLIGAGLQAAIGYYLLFEGRLLIDLCLRGVRGRCAGCGYDLNAITGPECPECGSPIQRPAAPQPPPAT